MNPAELEAKLTALLLDELTGDEAAELRQAIEQDANLAALYERLKFTTDLVRESAASPIEETTRQSAPLKLSSERREKLLAHFKTVAPAEFETPRRKLPWFVPISAAAALIVVAGLALLPELARSRMKSRSQRINIADNSPASAAAPVEELHEVPARRRSAGETVAPATPPRLPPAAVAPGRPKTAETRSYTMTVNGIDHGLMTNESSVSQANTLDLSQTLGTSLATSNHFIARNAYVGGTLSAGDSVSAAAPTSASTLDFFVSPDPSTTPPATAFDQNSNTLAANTTSSASTQYDWQFGSLAVNGGVAGGWKVAGGSGGGGGGGQTPATPAIAPAPPEVTTGTRGFYSYGDVNRSNPIISGTDVLTVSGGNLDITKGTGAVVDSFNFNANTTTPLFASADTSHRDAAGERLKEAAGLNASNTTSDYYLNLTREPRGSGNVALAGVKRVETEEAPALQADKPKEEVKLKSEPPASERFLVLQDKLDADENSIKQIKDALAKKETGASAPGEQIRKTQKQLSDDSDIAPPKPAAGVPIPQPEILTRENAFSTFSLNVSDVSFQLAAASLEKGALPEPASIRSEEFINAFDYRDPAPAAGVPVAFTAERARYPFAHNRDLLRFSLKTAAAGREAGRPLNLVLLLDNSGSMERADRVRIIQEALRVLASQLHPQDKFSIVTFARTARLVVDGVPGNQAGDAAQSVTGLTPQGGTNLEDALNLAYATARRHYAANGINRVVLLTDGAANLGSVEPEVLKQKVEAQRKQGIALDCFGIGWEGYNDDLLEVLSRNGDGRYAFINTPEEAATGFAARLAGALQVAASDVKVQVEFNPKRVTSYRQIGYAKHQLTKEQFRDNTVDAAEIAAAESGNALYTIEVNPAGEGPIATVRVRYKVPGTGDYREQEWAVPFNGNSMALEQAAPSMKLAATAGAFSEWLASNPFAGEVTTDRLLNYLSGVPEIYGADARPKKLEWMIRQAKSLGGK